MDIEKLATSLNGYLSIYAVRFLVVVIAVIFILIWVLIWRFLSKSNVVKIVNLVLLFLLLIGVGFVPFVVYDVPVIKENVLGVGLTLLPLWFLFSGFLLYFLSQKMYENNAKKSQKTFMVGSFVSIFLTLISLAFVLFVSFFARPYVALTGMEEDSIVDEDSTFKMRLTVPVLKRGLNIVISPQQKVDIVYDYVGVSTEWVDGFEIIPTENYPAESKIVVYVVGLSNLSGTGEVHEQSLEFFAPPLPNIQSSNFDSLEGDVNVEVDLEIALDKRSQSSVEWTFEITPPVEYETVLEDGKIKVDFTNLAQGTSYNVKVLRANRIYNTKSKEEIRVENQTVVKEYAFKTVDPPGIKDYNWKNVSLANTEPLVVEFSDRIALGSFTDLYRIEPPIAHTVSIGENGTSFILKPDTAFAKDTTYKLIFLKGLKTESGGFFEGDIEVPFKTAGAVRVVGFSPRNGIAGVKRGTKSVSVVFDQRVNHASAESKFSFSPSIPGSFSWSGNTMIYTFADTLDFYTKYTISVGAGVESIYGLPSKQAFSSSFTTEEQVVILPVPQFHQPRGFDCNLYATKMALAFRGVDISVDGAKASIGIGEDPNLSWVNEYGVHWGPISKLISGYRSNAIKGGWNAVGLATEVAKGNPSIVYVYNGASTPYGAFELPGGFTGYNGMHSEVVVGFTGRPDNPTTIITNDPWRGRRKYSVGSFNGIWGYMGNRAIVVY